MMNDMRSPIARVRGLGAGGNGTCHFWLLRLTAVANIGLSVFFIYFVLFLDYANYEKAVAFIRNPFVSLFFLLTLFSFLYHMYLGMQVVIGDYVHSLRVKLLLTILNVFFVLIIGVILALAFLKIFLGGGVL